VAYNVFPTFAGRGWGIKKRPITRTLIQQADSGAEYRTQRYQYPLYEFDIEIPYLTQADSDMLIGFYNQQGGPFQPFYFSADNDNSVSNHAFGTGDGTTTHFQLTKANGSYWSEPIAGVQGTPTIYVNGTFIVQSVSNPIAPTLAQTAGGSLAATSYYVLVTYVDLLSGETLPCNEINLAVGANNLLVVNSPASVQGATGWNVYVGTASGAEKLQNSSPLTLGSAWTESSGGLVTTMRSVPTVNSTGYTNTSSGLLTFGVAPNNGAPLTWTGQYYYLLRFKDDQIETTQTLSQIYEATTLTLRSVR